MLSSPRPTILMFSGGRDSTLAAVRLASVSTPLYLATVTSAHLIGLGAVRKRLLELEPLLPSTTRWLHVIQPTSLPGAGELMARTCLPCHRAYTAIGVALAKRFHAPCLAFGYARYQSAWPEQTPLAIERLGLVLFARGIQLTLPVYNLASKAEASEQLRRLNLSPAALEQKCLQQVSNIALEGPRLEKEIAVWELALRNTLAALETIVLDIVVDAPLSELAVAWQSPTQPSLRGLT